jgi:hypothetical protein
MRENLTYGSRWQGMETRTLSQAPSLDFTSRRRFAALYRGTIWLCEGSFQVGLDR